MGTVVHDSERTPQTGRSDREPVHRAVGQWAELIGSFLDAPDEAVVVLGGGLDAGAVERVAAHLEGVRAGGARFVTVDATALDSCQRSLLSVLGRTQQRLAARRGMLIVRGPRPDVFAGPTLSEPVPATPTPVDAQPSPDTA